MFPLHLNLHCQISVLYLKCMIFLIFTQWGYLNSPVSMCVCQRFITCTTWYLENVLSTHQQYTHVYYWLNKDVQSYKIIWLSRRKICRWLQLALSYCKKTGLVYVLNTKFIIWQLNRCHVNFIFTPIQSFQIL